MTDSTKLLFIPLTAFLFTVWTGAANSCAASATIKAASCTLEEVSRAVTQAGIGDTVSVPAGSCTWNNHLIIRKGITLQGAGAGKTILVAGAAIGTLIQYNPSDWALNSPFRLTGISFNLSYLSSGLVLGVVNKPAPFTEQTNIRVDHNEFYGSSTTKFTGIWAYGGMYGVVDNNTFEQLCVPIRHGPAIGNSSWWDNNTFAFGDPTKNIYYEDNIFNVSPICHFSGVISDCSYSGRYLFRYNTINTAVDSYPVFDMHGNMGSSRMWSCFGGEIYGNNINAGSHALRLIDHRGGEVMIFFNNASSTSTFWQIQAREEYQDSENPTNSQQPQHVSNSYYWNNRRNFRQDLSSIYVHTQLDEGEPRLVPSADQDFWVQGSSFDGTSGVGCGTLAARPPTCTPGVGYWATNQSCTDLTGMVGVNPASPISGTLYRCSSKNTWAPHYTPCVYPHPLRGSTKLPRPHSP